MQSISEDKTVRSDTIQETKELNHQSSTNQVKKGD